MLNKDTSLESKKDCNMMIHEDMWDISKPKRNCRIMEHC